MRRLLALMVAVVLAVAGCGADDGDEEATTGSDGVASDQVTEAGAADRAVGGDPGSAWCEAVREAADAGDSPLALDFLALTPTDLEARFRDDLAQLEDWERQAPPEIDGQVTTLVGAFRTLFGLAEDAGWDLVALASDPDALGSFDAPELQAAADDVAAHGRDVCGVDLELGLDGVSGLGGGGADVPATPPVEADDGAALLLQQFGLPDGLLTDDQLRCVSDELASRFPSGVPADLGLTPETVELFNDVAAACDIASP